MRNSLILFCLICISFSGCAQSEHDKYYKEVDKLLGFIISLDTSSIKSLMVSNLNHVGITDRTLFYNTNKFAGLIKKYGKPQGHQFRFKEYNSNDYKLCDVIVKVGNETESGILTASFYREYPNKIFLFDMAFYTKAKGIIEKPSPQ